MRSFASFDIFDTLVARKCVKPVEIFNILEAKAGIKNFSQIRRKAEASISGKPYTLDDIYHSISSTFGLPADVATKIKNLEIEEEIDNAIPIQENIDCVRDGDVLITDMYLPRYVIEKILDKVGIGKQVGLIVSSHGKISGDVWGKLTERFIIDEHVGDNQRSDVDRPLSVGIPARHFLNHRVSAHEEFFESNGLSGLSKLIRESRLKLVRHELDQVQRARLLAQINCNIPILLLASFDLYKKLCDHDINTVLFSSRDCYYMEKIFSCLARKSNWKVKSKYFLTSRVSRVKGSPAYLRYLRSLIGDHAAVVDLCGTGWSLGGLYEKAELSPHTYFVHFLKSAKSLDEYNSIREFRPIEKLDFLIDRQDLKNTIFEVMNYHGSGMFIDMHEIDGYDSRVPEFEPPRYPPAVVALNSEIATTHSAFLAVLEQSDVAVLLHESLQVLPRLPHIAAELYGDMIKNTPIFGDAVQYHSSREHKVMSDIRRGSCRN